MSPGWASDVLPVFPVLTAESLCICAPRRAALRHGGGRGGLAFGVMEGPHHQEGSFPALWRSKVSRQR